MDKKKYIEVLAAHAEKHGRAYELALNDFCDYLLRLFDGRKILSVEKYIPYLQQTLKEEPDFAALAITWLEDVSQAMEHGKYLDAFGELYEEMYLTPGKASRTGQFFTPGSLSMLCADIIHSEKNEASGTKELGRVVNDCAAGSGRLLLAHFMKVFNVSRSEGRRYRYFAQDMDPIACKMCALNMMAHGMNAQVVCQDTLAMSTPKVRYYINEAKYPINTPYYSIRAKLTENEQL